MAENEIHIYGTVKIGDRGQVVIPADARKELNLKPDDLLLVMSGKNRRGVTTVKADARDTSPTKLCTVSKSRKTQKPNC